MTSYSDAFKSTILTKGDFANVPISKRSPLPRSQPRPKPEYDYTSSFNMSNMNILMMGEHTVYVPKCYIDIPSVDGVNEMRYYGSGWGETEMYCSCGDFDSDLGESEDENSSKNEEHRVRKHLEFETSKNQWETMAKQRSVELTGNYTWKNLIGVDENNASHGKHVVRWIRKYTTIDNEGRLIYKEV